MGCSPSSVIVVKPTPIKDSEKQSDNVNAFSTHQQQVVETNEKSRVESRDKCQDQAGERYGAKPPPLYGSDNPRTSLITCQTQDKISDSIDDSTVYTAIDRHARSAPDHLRNSSIALVNYMKQSTSDEKLLVRGFFVWISENISYDVDEFFGKRKWSSAAVADVMRNGLSVCEGYARVMEELCRTAGITAKKITGYAKGFGYNPKRHITTSMCANHAWNAVCLSGNWYLMDCTWGSGTVDKAHQFKKEFNKFYFLTPPEQFVFAHFPYMDSNMDESMKWQLLKKPIRLDQWNTMVERHPESYRLGIVPASHQDGIVTIDDTLQMSFRIENEDDIRLMSSLDYIPSPHKLHDSKQLKFATRTEVENGVCKVSVHPRRKGWHRLHLYAKEKNSCGNYSVVISYIIFCKDVRDSTFEYIQYGSNDDNSLTIIPISHNSGVIEMSDEVTIKVKATDSADVVYLASLYRLSKTDNKRIKNERATFIRVQNRVCNIQVHPRTTGNYELDIFAKDANGNNYTFVMRYRLRCKRKTASSFEFPIVYSNDYTGKCQIMSPKNGLLPPNGVAKFEINAPELQKIKVGTTSLTKNESGTFFGIVKTEESGTKHTVYGCMQKDDHLSGLFQYRVDVKPLS